MAQRDAVERTTSRETSTPKGVMDPSYAADRSRRPALSFRLRYRALAAAGAYRRWAASEQPPRVLDLGAAEGAALTELHALLTPEYSVGVEYSTELVGLAQPLPKNCELRQGDVTTLRSLLPDQSFDLVTALAVLEHLADPVQLMRDLNQLLRPDGLFVATCPAGIWDRISGSLRLHQDEHHEQIVDEAFFHKLALAGGLTPREYRPFMLAPVAFVPYLGLPLSPRFCQRCDEFLRALHAPNIVYVNQLFVAQKSPRH